MKKQINFSAINLGCSKNLVDTEFVIGSLLGTSNEFNFFPDFEDKEVEFVVLNTCGFLSSSRDEAEEMMEYLDTLGKKIILIGCYIPVKDDEFLKSLKNLVAVIPYNEMKEREKSFKERIEEIKMRMQNGELKREILCHSELVSESLNNSHPNPLSTERGNIKNPPQLRGKADEVSKGELGDGNIIKDAEINSAGQDINFNKKYETFVFGTDTTRALLNAEKGYEYLKIAEGCNNNCSFCIIPYIRGKQKSRSIEDILKEVKIMLNSGIKEIEIIAQDTTRYGTDIYKTPKLLELLEEIDKIPGDFKYRLFYMYPDILSLKHLEKLSKLQKFIPYFDFPFQHISPKILKRMGRFYDEQHIYKLLEYIKIHFQNSFLHTNFIVGFPGETEEDFEMLLNFVKKIEFDSVSVFGYHDEFLASSSKLDQKVENKIIIERVKKLKKVLEEIYKKKNDVEVYPKIGFIEEIGENFVMIREEIKAPEIDELDKVKFENILSGEVEIGKKVEYII